MCTNFIVIIIIRYVCLLSQSFLPGTSLEPAVIPTAQASSFTLLLLLLLQHVTHELQCLNPTAFDVAALALETLQPMLTLEVKTDAGKAVSIFVSVSIETLRMHRNSTEV